MCSPAFSAHTQNMLPLSVITRFPVLATINRNRGLERLEESSPVTRHCLIQALTSSQAWWRKGAGRALDKRHHPDQAVVSERTIGRLLDRAPYRT
jgi:hypothetical protein